ncbi:hypothetical protein HYPSUDRAFT_80763 [Hypholoma sublateritium FD-334 SS-4]|uniref:F-box domain-containing protein n=1 Tax=Hypholoma sublateritium (strain FD-334 SS-4) TaxID=945553 RepID=A0A0D2LV24_HYPSF|nr:hypothetical protein HYPSUDRAFT_80763 [Hypholoma sublateritium FD-334 SS-4]
MGDLADAVPILPSAPAMHTGPPAALERHAPPPELNRDILGVIFEHCDHLGVVRDLSQVCWGWRDHLLKSPSVWARAFDLEMLDQKSDAWRALVLQRTGHELLSVRRRRPVLWDTPSRPFLADLLYRHWARIRDVDLVVTPEALDDPRMWGALRRPAPALRTFSCALLGIPGLAHPDVLLHMPNRPRGNFVLFANYAPALMELRLVAHFPALSLSAAASRTLLGSTGNLRRLVLARTVRMSDVDLLTACMQLPCIETLTLSLARFKRSPPSHTDALRPLVPRLKLIELTEINPCIYSAFLDHIVPAADCALSIAHPLVSWSESAADSSSLEAQDVGHMGCVAGHYAYSYIEHAGVPLDTIQLTIARQEFVFEIPGGHGCQFRIAAEQKRRENDEDDEDVPDFLAPLVASLLGAPLPPCITTLKMEFRRADNFLCRAPPLQALASMGAITVLDTYSFYLAHLHRGQLEQPALPLPALATLVLRDRALDAGALQEGMLPFLVHRFYAAPVAVLEFASAVDAPCDLRFLDVLTGLKVVWTVAGRLRPLEYVCGSGDTAQLWFAGGP